MAIINYLYVLIILVDLNNYMLCIPMDPACIGGCYKPKIEKHTTRYYQRVEVIKREILEKLGLEKPPIVTALSKEIPKIVINNFWKGISETSPDDNGQNKMKTLLIPSEKGL